MEHQEAFEELAVIVERMVPGAPEYAREWLRWWLEQEVPALGQVKPAELLGTTEDVATVKTVLLQIESGAYS